jgi:hypothetical protein
MSSGGIFGTKFDNVPRDAEPSEQTPIPRLNVTELLRRVAPRKLERERLVAEIENRFLMHYAVLENNVGTTH